MRADQSARYPSLAGRVVLISGGASGIGASLVEAFTHQQAQVIFLDLNETAANDLLQRLAAAAPQPSFYRCDLTDTTALQETVRSLLSRFGKVDVLINNAGNDTRHNIDEVTPELWDKILDVNLKHQFFLTQAVIPSMREAGRGSIINMSSIGWVIPSTRVPAYVTAKAGIVGLTRTLAHELGAHNIRVNCVMPGAIVTERQQRLWLTEQYKAEILARQALKRLLQPEEVARLVLFLAADDSAGITNQSHVIDGGWI